MTGSVQGPPGGESQVLPRCRVQARHAACLHGRVSWLLGGWTFSAARDGTGSRRRPRVTTDPLLLGAPPHEWPPAGNSRAIRSDVSLPVGEGIEAGGTRAGGAVGLPGVWRFLMSPVRRGPAGQARSWEAGGPWRESTLAACPGHHGLACPASRPCHGALP